MPCLSGWWLLWGEDRRSLYYLIHDGWDLVLIGRKEGTRGVLILSPCAYSDHRYERRSRCLFLLWGLFFIYKQVTFPQITALSEINLPLKLQFLPTQVTGRHCYTRLSQFHFNYLDSICSCDILMVFRNCCSKVQDYIKIWNQYVIGFQWLWKERRFYLIAGTNDMFY